MTDHFTSLLKQGVEHLTEAPRMIALLPLLPTIIVIALILTGCDEASSASPSPPRPVKYLTVAPPSAIAEGKLTGEIRAHDEIALAFRLDGKVLTRSVDVGARISRGDTLATLEDNSGTNQVISAQAELASARAAERVAVLNQKRMQLLMPSGAISRAQFDAAQADAQSATARRQGSEASLKNAHDTLNWTRLTAPASGIITAVNVSAGQVVSAGQTVLTMASGTRRDVVFDVTDAQRLNLSPQAVYHLSLLRDAAIAATGQLRDISPQADPQTRTWRVRITLDNPPTEMILGTSVSVALPQSGAPVITLPASSLTRLAGRPAVFVVDADNQQVRRRVVTISGFTASSVYVASGLTAGERVVTAGVSSLRDGEKVTAGDEQS